MRVEQISLVIAGLVLMFIAIYLWVSSNLGIALWVCDSHPDLIQHDREFKCDMLHIYAENSSGLSLLNVDCTFPEAYHLEDGTCLVLVRDLRARTDLDTQWVFYGEIYDPEGGYGHGMD